MKKSLLILMLLPLCALAQNPLVKWHGITVPISQWNTAPSTNPSYFDGSNNSISANNITGVGISFNYNAYNGFEGSNWSSSSTTPDAGKYFLLVLEPKQGKQFDLSQLKLVYKGGCSKMRVSYAKSLVASPSFTNPTSHDLSNLVNNNNDTEVSFTLSGSHKTVVYGERLEIRIYGYQSNGGIWMLRDNVSSTPQAGGPGVALYGSISNYASGAPTAVADSGITTMENQSKVIDILANDNIGSSALTAITPTTPAHGTVTVNGTTNVTYTPTTGYSGPDTFNYTIKNATGTSNSVAVSITVNPFIAPTANNTTASVTENSSVTVNVLGSITMGSSNTVSQLTASTPAHGTTSITGDNKVLYTPTTGYYGADSFTYTVKDSNNKTATATVNVTVTELARPVANNDSATTGQNIAITINALSNDTAGAGTINSITITGQPANGTATVNGSNNIVYTPSSSFTGTNTITYKITDTNGKFATATITVTVQAIIAASASNDTATTAKNTPITLDVLSNDTVGNSALTAMVITVQPAHGSVIVNGNNTISYTPANNYTGNDSFKYKITNAYGTSSTATVSLQVLHPTATGALCGTYVISAIQQADYPQFSTITAAVAHLNQYGVTCPVTFILNDAVYNNASGEVFPITINTISGSSVTNTVTFKPGAYKNVRIEAFRDAVTGSYTGVPAVFKLDGTDNVIFDGSNTVNGTTRNLTIVNSSFAGGEDHGNDYTARAVIWLATPSGSNGCENITVKYAGIKQTWKNTSDNFCVGIYAGNSSVGGNNALSIGESYTAHKNIRITSNDFTNVKQGIYINGNAGTPSQNIYIHQNDLGAENNSETIIQPCAIKNVNGFEFTENFMYKLYRNNAAASLISSGIYVSGNSQNGLIAKNDMKDFVKTLDEGVWFAGIVLDTDIQGNNNITVVNNFILNIAGNNTTNYKGNGHGIVVVKGTGYKIYHNTVVLNTSQTGGAQGYAAALYVESGAALDVRNNIFANNQTNTQTRRTAIAVKANYSNMGSIFTHLDYNSLFSADKLAFVANQWSAGDIESWNSPDYLTSLSGWQSITGKDAHSVNYNPVFVSATDLHLAEGNGAIDNEGIFIPAVTKDIDGQLRSTSKPTIGADEYGEPEMPTGETNQGIYCATSTRYQNGVWSNGLPTAEKDVIFASDFTQTGGTLYACSIYVIGTAKVNFISHSSAIVTHAVNVAATGSLTFESGSSLRQIENTANTGNVVIKRNSSSLKRLDYTLWSSPVKKQKLLAFSPATMTDRFYTYNTATDQYNAIASNLVATTNFADAKGYLIRMPNSYATTGYNAGTTAIVYPGKFTGTPNNGTIRIPLVYGRYTNGVADNNGAIKQYNAIGNPYASPINITDFLTENEEVIDGTIYMWRKTNDYTKSSYWTVNKSGATANAAPGGINDLVNYPHAIDPTGLINTAQGFIVKALGSNKEVVFKNNMRRSETYDNFFRMPGSANNVDDAPSQGGVPNASRVWLNSENSGGTFAQTMIAYTDIATTGYDNGYDGAALLDGGVSVYSIIPEYKLAIQSLPAFTDSNIVKLGFKTTLEGTFEVKIYEQDGLFAAGQAVYLKDNQTNTFHNLQDGNYTFISEVGTFEDRFEVHYTTDSALGNDTPQIAAKDVMIYANEKQIKVKSTETIATVKVYDVLGKLVYEKNNIGAGEFSTSTLTTAQQVLVVNVTFEGGQAVSKKIMMN